MTSSLVGIRAATSAEMRIKSRKFKAADEKRCLAS